MSNIFIICCGLIFSKCFVLIFSLEMESLLLMSMNEKQIKYLNLWKSKSLPKSLMFLPRCDVLCASRTEQTTGKWNLFVLYNKNSRSYGILGAWKETKTSPLTWIWAYVRYSALFKRKISMLPQHALHSLYG